MAKLFLVVLGIIFIGSLAYILNQAEQSVQKNPEAQVTPSTPVTVQGKIICLPHKDQTGPQTLECAIGLQDEQGNNYALADADPEASLIAGIPQNVTVTVEGMLKAQSESKYAVIGVIEVSAIKQNENSGLPAGYTLENYEVAETTDVACTADQECETPAEYLLRSSCPYTSLCLEGKCAVVCPRPSE